MDRTRGCPSMRRSFRAFVSDDTATALPEYALVLTSLTILGLLAFTYVGKTANNVINTDANNFVQQNYHPTL